MICFYLPKATKKQRSSCSCTKRLVARLAISKPWLSNIWIMQHMMLCWCCMRQVICHIVGVIFSSPNSITAEREMQRAVVTVPSLGFFHDTWVSAIDYNHRCEWSLCFCILQNSFSLGSITPYKIFFSFSLGSVHPHGPLHLLFHDPLIVASSLTWD